MNNWLGFSLSPHHQHQHQQQQQQLPFTSDVPAECFDFMPPDSSSLPSCLHPQTLPFGLVPAFNRDTAAAHSQDWNSKDANIIGSYSCSNQETPKLENFLGHSFSDSNHQEPNKQQIQSHPIASSTDYNYISTTTTTMGLSMIKNWLRNNPLAATNTKATESAVAPAPAPTMPSGVQTLSLSMSTGSSGGGNLQQCGTDGAAAAPPTDTNQSSGGAIESLPRKSIDTFGQRTSIYRGVTRHRWTGRYEAHLWDNSCRREGQTRKGRQVYLGGYDKEEKAARTYDLAALKYWGTTTTTNFAISNYEKEMEEMKHMTRQEYVASLRRKSSGFSRGASIYRGVTRHHQHGRWQARIGRVAGNKDLYLGTFSTQEEAAEAYDIAAIKFRGLNAVTNFEISRYDVKSIMESATLPIGGAAKRLKDAETAAENMALELHRVVDERNAPNLHAMDHEAHLNGYGAHRHHHPYPQHAWPSVALQQGHGVANIYPYSTNQRLWCKQEQDPESGFNDHQLEGNTQNFLLHKLMSLDSCSNPGAGVYESNGSGAGFGVPLPMMMNQEEGSNEDRGMFGSGDGYQQHQQARNLYYSQESSNNGMAAMGMARVYDHQGSLCNNWIPTGVPTLASSKGNTMAVCHGASTNFTVWNDT